MAVGAGVGMMLAPMSGQQLRTRIFDRLRGAKGQVPATRQEAQKVEAKAESVIDKPGDGATQVRQQSASRIVSRQPISS